MSQVTFRPFTPQDAEIAPKLFIDALQTVYPDIQSGKWDSDLNDIPGNYQADGGDFLMGEANGKVIAQGGIHRLDNSTAEMKRVAVEPEAQGGGIGQQLIEALEGRARELGFTRMVLDTTFAQAAARHVYEKAGYRLIDRKNVDHPSGTPFDTFFYEKYLIDHEVEEQLDRAFANPLVLDLKDRPKVSAEDLAARDQYFGRQSRSQANEDIPIRSFESPDHDYEVRTDDPEKFRLLLAQAMRRLEIAKGLADPGIEITDQLEKTARHELAHGKMAKALGVGSLYGVRVLHDPTENIWALSPFHKITGNSIGEIMLTRLEDAAISVAPEDASPADLRSAQAAGYFSRDEVLQRLFARHPHLKYEFNQ